jgi:SAM-dependent methyltransferase
MARPAPPRPRHRWHAAIYDPVVRPDRQLRSLRDLLLADVSGSVLEVGCGTGLNLEHYRWQQVESLEATEPDPFMLAKAVEKLKALPPDLQAKARCIEPPAEALPYPDAAFDAVVATLVLCTVSNVDQSLAEVRRVLRPDGRLHLLEHVRGAGLAAGAQQAIAPLWRYFAAGCNLTRDTEQAVRDAGFDLEVVQRVRLGPLMPAFLGIARPVT